MPAKIGKAQYLVKTEASCQNVPATAGTVGMGKDFVEPSEEEHKFG